MYSHKVKLKYEVALKQHVKNSVVDDYESVEFITASNYRDAVRIAKSASVNTDNKRFKKTRTLDEGLAQVVIVCYYSDSTTDYNEVWQEEYVNGKKTERYVV